MFDIRLDYDDATCRGELKLPTFSFIMRDPRLKNIPLILETPTNEDTNVWKREIEVRKYVYGYQFL